MDYSANLELEFRRIQNNNNNNNSIHLEDIKTKRLLTYEEEGEIFLIYNAKLSRFKLELTI
jgi:hypothetical protein